MPWGIEEMKSSTGMSAGADAVVSSVLSWGMAPLSPTPSPGRGPSPAPDRVAPCLSSPPPRPTPTVRACCCSTATRWPTGRSSRSRSRTSPRRPGQHTNAVYGFTSMLINVLRDEQPTHVAVAFDVSRQGFRMDEYAEYKAKRNKTPDEFKSQLPLIEEVLDALRIPFLEKEGYEADDIIATLATQALAEDLEVLILHRRPRQPPAGDRPLDGALPDARRLRPGPDDPGGGRDQVRRAAAPLPRARGAGGGGLRQPARASRASARRPPPSGSPSTTASTTSSPTPTRSRARPATTCASTSPT